MQWASTFSFSSFVVGVLLANAVLTVFSILSGYIASREGLTFALASEKVFGFRGALIPSMWSGAVSLGWLAFSLGVVADGIVYMLSLPKWLYYVVAPVLLALFSIAAYLGSRYMAVAAKVVTPALAVLTIVAAPLSIARWGYPNTGALDLRELPAVFSLALGSFVNGAITLSFDFERFCYKPRDVVVVATATFVLLRSLAIIAPGVAAASSGMDLYSTYNALGLLPLTIAVLLLSVWVSANNQLYSTSLSWTLAARSLGIGVDRRRVFIFAEILALLMAEARLHTYALQWLSTLTTVSLPAGVVIWTHYYVTHRGSLSSWRGAWNTKGFIAWVAGSATIAYLYLVNGMWVGIPTGFAVAMAIYIALTRIAR
jgi:cytosine permease